MTTAARPPRTGAGRALAEQFARHIQERRLLPPGSIVLVALSGGIDSMALLHLLRFGAPQPVHLRAAHFDHRMRAESSGDALWVRGAGVAWDVPVEVGAATTPPRSEGAARDARYAFLDAAARRAGADLIVTAHHADDQAETVLFRLLRGTGLHGLAGIRERRLPFVRPLLPFRRRWVEAYATAVGLRHREDPTNVDLSRARNRIRHVILPALERARPGITDELAALSHDAALADRIVRRTLEPLERRLVFESSDGSLVLARDLLLGYHPVVRARVLRHVLQRLGRPPGRTGTRAALEFIRSRAGGGVIALGGGVRLERSFDRLVIQRAPPADADAGSDRVLVISEPDQGQGEAVIGGRRFSVHWSPSRRDPHGHAAVFDSNALRFPLVVRGWRPGDRIRLAYGSKKLKKLFAERRIARSARSRIPILAEGREGDRIVWVVGLARAAVAQPAHGDPVLHVMVTEADAEHG